MKYQVLYSDENYRDAVNYLQLLYNSPVTINTAGKKYILGVGSSDRLTVKVRKGLVYILGVNSGLSYISLTVIDPKTDSVDDVFFDQPQLDEVEKSNLLDYSPNYQIRFLNKYIGLN